MTTATVAGVTDQVADALTKTPLRAFAHGGGVQSTAALVLSAQGKIDFLVHLFSNVGDDSENPATLTYVHEVSIPYAKEHGIDLVELHKLRFGEPETLVSRMLRDGSKSIPIPVYMSGGVPTNRACTVNFKLDVLMKWLKQNGATEAEPAVMGIGISVDEIHRAKPSAYPIQRTEHPLIALGLTRSDCLDIIRAAELPEPPKSSCFFCPYHRPSVWREMARDEPELFERAAVLEDALNERRDELSKDRVYLTRMGIPLREAIRPAQQTMFGDGSPEIETCDEGVCFV